VTAQPVPEVGLVERAVDQLAKPGTLAVVLVLAAAGVLLALVGARRREGQRA
jgi:hypothetical protein